MARQAEALAKVGRASGYRALYSCLEGRRVSLNTYARKWNWPASRSSPGAARLRLSSYGGQPSRSLRSAKAGVPCGSCTHLNGFADRCLRCSANGTEARAASTLRIAPGTGARARRPIGRTQGRGRGIFSRPRWKVQDSLGDSVRAAPLLSSLARSRPAGREPTWWLPPATR